ncbi:MAG: hypothetical protein JWQ50_3705 [Caballeronia mineralivorans]|jgi:hypothetical protein|nr:hypothetical protein [Caballeronia mineralivorans]
MDRCKHIKNGGQNQLIAVFLDRITERLNYPANSLSTLSSRRCT